MKAEDLDTVDQLRAFLDGIQPVALVVVSDKDSRYLWVQRMLKKFDYDRLGRADKGVVLRYLQKVSGYSRQQVTRLVRQYRDCGRVVRRPRTVNGFKRRYTARDVALLADMDTLHDTPNGATMKKLCERMHLHFKAPEFERLAAISVSHLYNLRNSDAYRRQRRWVQKTRPRASSIGERRKPQPDGRPGHIRIDTVHQGDWGRRKGVYHLNAVDEVTQMQVVASVQGISERFLIPALERMIGDFPFVILGFHCDNGSEYINHRVARLLEKLRIEFTKSRSRQTNDNALVESKNGHVVRKFFGHSHIPCACAEQVNAFNRDHLNPYVNYHRPCLFPVTHTNAQGKQRKRYPYALVETPYEKFKSLPGAKGYLKPGLSFAELDQIAYRVSDNQAADALQVARRRLFDTIAQVEANRA